MHVTSEQKGATTDVLSVISAPTCLCPYDFVQVSLIWALEAQPFTDAEVFTHA